MTLLFESHRLSFYSFFFIIYTEHWIIRFVPTLKVSPGIIFILRQWQLFKVSHWFEICFKPTVSCSFLYRSKITKAKWKLKLNENFKTITTQNFLYCHSNKTKKLCNIQVLEPAERIKCILHAIYCGLIDRSPGPAFTCGANN